MQAQAYRCTKQLWCAASTVFTSHSINSGITTGRCQLQSVHNSNRMLVSNPSVVFCRRWTSVFSTSRLGLPRHFSHKSYKTSNCVALKSNARFYSSKKSKYCLKRLVKGQKASRTKAGLESIKDVVSGVNESIQQRADVLQNRMLQAVFAMNADVISKPVTHQIVKPHTLKPVTIVSFTDKSDNKLAEPDAPVNKTNESFNANVQVLPLSNVTNQVVNDIKLRRWHRITGAIRSIPSPNWGRIIPLVSRTKNSNPKQEVEEVTSDVNQSQKEEITETLTSEQVNATSTDQDLSVDTPSGGFDCDQTMTETNSTLQASSVANSIESDQASSPQNSTFNQRMYSLRDRLPPLGIPSSMSDRLPSLSETTSKVKQSVGSVKLTKWTNSDKSSSPDGKGDFDLDSPLLMAEAKQAYKEQHKSDSSLVAEQLLKSTNSDAAEIVKAAKVKTAKKIFKPVSKL